LGQTTAFGFQKPQIAFACRNVNDAKLQQTTMLLGKIIGLINANFRRKQSGINAASSVSGGE
jgi:hypothetical protein